jgi:hypothetical protein
MESQIAPMVLRILKCAAASKLIPAPQFAKHRCDEKGLLASLQIWSCLKREEVFLLICWLVFEISSRPSFVNAEIRFEVRFELRPRFYSNDKAFEQADYVTLKDVMEDYVCMMEELFYDSKNTVIEALKAHCRKKVLKSCELRLKIDLLYAILKSFANIKVALFRVLLCAKCL